MHLGIDAVGAIHGGAATVLLSVLDAALQHPSISRVTLFCAPKKKREFEFPASSKLFLCERPQEQASKLRRLWWLHQGLAQQAQRAGVERLLLLSNAGVPPNGIPAATFLQQSIPFSPEVLRLLPWKKRLSFAIIHREMAQSAKATRQVFVQTETMRKNVEKSFNLKANRVHVFPPSAPIDCVPQTQLRAEAKRLLYVGSDAPYKNLRNLISAFQRLRAMKPEAELWLTLPQEHSFREIPGLHLLGYLPRRDLVKKLHEVDLLVMPSLVETVGLPLLEAMASGLPILAADRPYAREVCRDAAWFFDPLSPEACAEGAWKLLEDLPARQGLATRGLQRSQHFHHSKPYEAMLERLLFSSPSA